MTGSTPQPAPEPKPGPAEAESSKDVPLQRAAPPAAGSPDAGSGPNQPVLESPPEHHVPSTEDRTQPEPTLGTDGLDSHIKTTMSTPARDNRQP